MDRRDCLRALGAALVAASAPARAGTGPTLVTGAEWQDDTMVSWAELIVGADVEHVFAVLSDYDHHARFLPGVLASRVLARRGPTVEIEQELEEAVLFFRQRLKVRMAVVETPPRQLTIRSLAGSFRAFDGQYVLMPVAAGLGGAAAGSPRTRLQYHARFEPDFDLPRMIGPFVVKRSLEKNFRALAGEIARRAGGGPDAGEGAAPAHGMAS